MGRDSQKEAAGVRIEYDPERDLLYIYFASPGVKSAETVTVAPGVHADFGRETTGHRRDRRFRNSGKRNRVTSDPCEIVHMQQGGEFHRAGEWRREDGLTTSGHRHFGRAILSVKRVILRYVRKYGQ